MAGRVTTGITDRSGKISLDKSLGGGIPQGNIVLITGAPGTAKSIFCYTVTAENAKKGQKCLYAAFDQIEQDIVDQAKNVGIDLKGRNIKLMTFQSLNDLKIDALIDMIREEKFDFVVLDSLASISGIIPPEDFEKMGQGKIYQNYFPVLKSESTVIRAAVRRLVLALKEAGVTALLINELPEGSQELSKDGESDFLADGIIVMHYFGIGSQEFRSLQIRKMRQTSHEKDLILFNITKDGIELQEEEELKQ